MSLAKCITFNGEQVATVKNTIIENTDKLRDFIEDSNHAYIHVELVARKILRKKIFGIFPVYDKFLVFRLVYQLPETANEKESYEEYNTHKEIYERIATSKIYGGQFPKCVSINEFIDKGFTVKIM